MERDHTIRNVTMFAGAAVTTYKFAFWLRTIGSMFNGVHFQAGMPVWKCKWEDSVIGGAFHPNSKMVTFNRVVTAFLNYIVLCFLLSVVATIPLCLVGLIPVAALLPFFAVSIGCVAAYKDLGFRKKEIEVLRSIVWESPQLVAPINDVSAVRLGFTNLEGYLTYLFWKTQPISDTLKSEILSENEYFSEMPPRGDEAMRREALCFLKAYQKEVDPSLLGDSFHQFTLSRLKDRMRNDRFKEWTGLQYKQILKEHAKLSGGNYATN